MLYPQARRMCTKSYLLSGHLISIDRSALSSLGCRNLRYIILMLKLILIGYLIISDNHNSIIDLNLKKKKPCKINKHIRTKVFTAKDVLKVTLFKTFNDMEFSFYIIQLKK